MEDTSEVISYLQQSSPFTADKFLGTGTVADGTINVDSAKSIGNNIEKNAITYSFKKKSQAQNLS